MVLRRMLPLALLTWAVGSTLLTPLLLMTALLDPAQELHLKLLAILWGLHPDHQSLFHVS